MTFFYDLNKRLANLSQKQTLAEGAVAERATGDYSATKARAGKDIGKPGKNFSKIAADAGKRYGSKAAGERVAGAELNKLRHPKEGMDEAVRGLTVGKAGIRPPVNQAERDIIAKQFKQTRATNRADTTTTGYGNRVAPQGGRASAGNTGSLAVRTEPTYHGQETPVVYKDTYYQDAKHTNDRTGKLMMKPSQGKGVAGQPGVTEADMDEAIRIMAKPEGSQVTRGTAAYVPKNSIAGKTPQGQAHRDATAAMAKSARAAGGKLAMNKTTDVTGKRVPGGYDAMAKGVTPYRSSVEEADMEEGNDFTGARLAAIKANKPTFTVGGKTYKVTGDTSDEKMMEDFDEGGKKQMTDEGAGQFYVYHKVKGDRAGGADYDLLKTFPDKSSAMSFAQTYNNKISADKKNFHSAVVRTKSVKKDMDEGWDEMERDVKRRLSTPKVGDVKRGARHDIETTATGVRATRRHDDDEADEQPTGEKRGRGRPKSAGGPRQERTTAKSRKTDRTAYTKKKTNEEGFMPGATDADAGEYGYEGDMAKDQIHTIVRHAKDLEKILSNREDLPEWVQSKLAKIEGMMTAVDDYMQTQHERGSEMDQGIDLEEESTDTRDNRAERAGKRVTKDLEYDMKHKGKDDAKAERAGRKVTKDIEYDEKKKEKKVAETTSSGSVATGGAAPKASKGSMQVGKGIYDSLNREVENMIAESMSVNVSMTRDDNGAHKNITVTADDEDAEALAQLLRSAGLGGGMSHDHGHEEPCPDCGSTDCGCDEGMAEAYGDTNASQNKPNWPTDTEYSDDAMQYSGGLNKPKTDVAGDGQSTVPVTAVHTQEEDELRRLREMAGIAQQRLMPWERTMKEEAVAEDELEEGLKDKLAAAALAGSMALGAGGAHAGTPGNQDTSSAPQAAGQTVGSMAQAQRTNYQLRSMINTVKDLKQQNRLDPGFEKDYNQMQTVSTTGSPDSKVAADFANAKMLKQLFQKYNMTLPYVQEGVAEGVVDTVKGAVKKGLEKLGHGSDEEMRKDLQKKMGVPVTGEKPKDDKKMQESLMQEFANFKI